MDIEKMHFTGPIWRPPYEAGSVLLQATVGCTHHRCKFCSLYPGIEFRVSPMSEIVSDLEIIRHYQPRARRVFLTGANPFALSFDRLKELAMTVHDYLPRCRIGTFSRISDIKHKTVEQLKELRSYGFNGLSIGTETGDDITLAEMNKGNTAQDTFEQCRKLEEAGIEYYIVYLTGLAGKGNGRRNGERKIIQPAETVHHIRSVLDPVSRIGTLRGRGKRKLCGISRARKTGGADDFHRKSRKQDDAARRYRIQSRSDKRFFARRQEQNLGRIKEDEGKYR